MQHDFLRSSLLSAKPNNNILFRLGTRIDDGTRDLFNVHRIMCIAETMP